MASAEGVSARLGQVQAHLSGNSSSISKSTSSVYILGAARTPTAAFNGSFRTVSAPHLGAVAIEAAVRKAKIPISFVSDVYMGNVLQASQGQAPARQAMVLAGLPTSIDAVTINKVCSSGLKAVMMAAQNIQLGLSEAQVAGGMENMTRVPYLLARPSLNPSFGTIPFEDGLIKDGLWDVYNQFHMGNCAEHSAKMYGISREEQDEYAFKSFRRAQKAWKEGRFEEEIAPVNVPGKGGAVITINKDEGYLNLNEEKARKLNPVFVKDGTGTITAANASPMNDGASAVVLASAALAAKYGKGSRVLSQIISYADAAVEPIDFSTAPSKSIQLALDRAGLQAKDISVWEINEAFAAVVKINQKLLGLDDDTRINELGGAIALGHALGSSGSRILTTLVHELKVGEYGVAALCNGGGASSAMIVRRVDYADL